MCIEWLISRLQLPMALLERRSNDSIETSGIRRSPGVDPVGKSASIALSPTEYG